MQISAEVRWFWQGTGPPMLQEWFMDARFHEHTAGGGSVRTDAYLPDPQQAELGIKLRGNKSGVEIKGLVAVAREVCSDAPFVGSIEVWGKWSSKELRLSDAALIIVSKHRWLRKFSTDGAQVREIALDAQELPIDKNHSPTEGCDVEYTEISIDGSSSWVTLGFEAFGTLDTIVANLHRVTAHVSRRRPPAFGNAWCASYPVWLQRFAAPAHG
jgi:hypothetical protein